MQMYARCRLKSIQKLTCVSPLINGTASSEYLTGGITLEIASTLRTLLCAGVEIPELLNALQVLRNAIDRAWKINTRVKDPKSETPRTSFKRRSRSVETISYERLPRLPRELSPPVSRAVPVSRVVRAYSPKTNRALSFAISLEIENFLADDELGFSHGIAHRLHLPLPPPPPAPGFVLFRSCATQRPVRCATSFENRRSLGGVIEAVWRILNKMSSRSSRVGCTNSNTELRRGSFVLTCSTLDYVFEAIEVRGHVLQMVDGREALAAHYVVRVLNESHLVDIYFASTYVARLI